jgi:hypothetical protein
MSNNEMLDPDVFVRRPPWNGKVYIKELLTSKDLSPEEVKELGKKVAGRLKLQPRFQDEEIIENFENVDDQDEFNSIMEDLYNYCDTVRIWVE